MLIQNTGRNKWLIQGHREEKAIEVILDLEGSMDTLTVLRNGDTLFTLTKNNLPFSLLKALDELWVQAELNAIPSEIVDEFMEPLNQVLRNLGCNPYVQEYGDEDEDCRSVFYPICFANGEYKLVIDDMVYTAEKSGNKHIIAVSRSRFDDRHELYEATTRMWRSSTKLGALTADDVLKLFK